jgi:hypothetical protein
VILDDHQKLFGLCGAKANITILDDDTLTAWNAFVGNPKNMHMLSRNLGLDRDLNAKDLTNPFQLTPDGSGSGAKRLTYIVIAAVAAFSADIAKGIAEDVIRKTLEDIYVGHIYPALQNSLGVDRVGTLTHVPYHDSGSPYDNRY